MCVCQCPYDRRLLFSNKFNQINIGSRHKEIFLSFSNSHGVLLIIVMPKFIIYSFIYCVYTLNDKFENYWGSK